MIYLKVCCPALVFSGSGASSSGSFNFATISLTPASSGVTLPTNDFDRCGMSNATHSRVVGGMNAQIGAYPWIAALGYQISGTIRFLCGGTLITQLHVLTAGHCVKDSLVLTRLGDYDISVYDAGEIDIPIVQKILHENYDSKNILNDIAILKLAQIVPITDRIHPVCLPLGDFFKYRDLTGYQPFVAGWGSTSFQGPLATVLQEVQLPILPLAQCEFNYRLYFPNQVFDTRVMCAGYPEGGKDSCQGDSGGALLLPTPSADGSYYYYNIIGIVSYGFECARAGFPGIYSRVTTFLPWIQLHIND